MPQSLRTTSLKYPGPLAVHTILEPRVKTNNHYTSLNIDHRVSPAYTVMSSALTLPPSFAHEGDSARALAIRAREDCESRLRSLWPSALDDHPTQKAISYKSDDDSHNTLSLEEELSQAEQDFREKVGLYEAAALSLHYAGEDWGQRPNNFAFNVGIYDKRRKALESELEHTTT